MQGIVFVALERYWGARLGEAVRDHILDTAAPVSIVVCDDGSASMPRPWRASARPPVGRSTSTAHVDIIVGHGTTFTLDLPCTPAASATHEWMVGA